MRKFLVVALAIASGILPSVTEGQGSTSGSSVIIGHVTDAVTKKPLADAKITVERSVRETASDKDGAFRLVQVPEGRRTVTVRLVGYAKFTREIALSIGATSTLDVALQPSANMLGQVVVAGTAFATELKSVPNEVTIITSQEIERRNIRHIDQLFRGDVPGLFALNLGSGQAIDSVLMFSRGANTFATSAIPTITSAPPAGAIAATPIKTYLDGIELTNYAYLNGIDPRSIDRIEIIPGPQASTIYGSNAIGGVMQVYTKRGAAQRYAINATLMSGTIENNFSSSVAPQHEAYGDISGTEGRLNYYTEGSVDYLGQWTPAKKVTNTNASASARMQFGPLVAQIAARMGNMRNVAAGSVNQTLENLNSNGQFVEPILVYNSALGANALQTTVNGLYGLALPMTTTRTAQTFSASADYTPVAWWTHNITAGSDAGKTEAVQNQRSYFRYATTPTTTVPPSQLIQGFDTLYAVNNSNSTRNSARYTTTAKFPIAGMVQAVVTAGVDEWSRILTTLNTPGSTLIVGSLSGVSLSRFTDRNHGGFVQGQFGWQDQLFVTLGLRSEWNRSIGDNANPDIAPRYGISYVHDLGGITAKVRGNYGRAIRPPALRTAPDTFATAAGNLTVFGKYKAQIGNPDLKPESQNGVEGGLDLYFNNRSSLSFTAYNQTVSDLIRSFITDSTKSLLVSTSACGNTATVTVFSTVFDPVSSFCYAYQTKNYNLGGIRNTGFDVQGTTTYGPFSGKAIYSFTKSRMMPITAAYRAKFPLATNPTLQSDYSFQYFPEHNYALGLTYSEMATVVSLNVNGVGAFTRFNDEFTKLMGGRLEAQRPRMDIPVNYKPAPSKGYATADLSASHQCTKKLQTLLQVDNLTNHYQNDFSVLFPTIGRQTRIGIRYRM